MLPTNERIEKLMKITLDSNPSDAPCCVKIIADNGEDRLIQTDWDFPAIASTFGWSISELSAPDKKHGNRCEHVQTDGTVKCPDCDTTPSEFIQAAREWLDDNDGAEAEDPGYFTQD